MKAVLDVLAQHKRGARVGLPSVCSAHPLVIQAALQAGHAAGVPLLIEATCNQVNQDGGYTGMTPADYRAQVLALARAEGVPEANVLLGGDHLGPNPWRHLSAQEAMAKAERLVHDYCGAGFRKLHLDCSMACADDTAPLPDAVVAQRAARLAAVAEAAWEAAGGEPPVYVVGTEVPVPGGAHETLDTLAVTAPAAVAQTLAAHEAAFGALGLHSAWSRAIALVVQPGVEFDHHQVIDYVPHKAQALSRFIEAVPDVVFEAHSTDYQTPEALAALVQGHFAILKVGPGVTFALRETLWAMADIECQWLGEDHPERSRLKEVTLAVMREQPANWKPYYHDEAHLQTDLAFSLSDRIRYYWPEPRIEAAYQQMLANLSRNPPPLTLLSQYLPRQYAAIRAGRLGRDPSDWLRAGVQHALQPYLDACGAKPQAANA